MLYIWWDQKSVVYDELLKHNETIISVCYQKQLVNLSQPLKEKCPEYVNRHNKVTFQHDNARTQIVKVVKGQLQLLKWDVLPHLPHLLDIEPLGYHLF